MKANMLIQCKNYCSISIFNRDFVVAMQSCTSPRFLSPSPNVGDYLSPSPSPTRSGLESNDLSLPPHVLSVEISNSNF